MQSIYCCNFWQMLTKSVPALRPTLHIQNNSLLQSALAVGHDSHCERPVSPIDRVSEHLLQIPRMRSFWIENCSPPLLECVHDRVSVLVSVLLHVVAFAQLCRAILTGSCHAPRWCGLTHVVGLHLHRMEHGAVPTCRRPR